MSISLSSYSLSISTIIGDMLKASVTKTFPLLHHPCLIYPSPFFSLLLLPLLLFCFSFFPNPHLLNSFPLVIYLLFLFCLFSCFFFIEISPFHSSCLYCSSFLSHIFSFSFLLNSSNFSFISFYIFHIFQHLLHQL